MILHCPLNGPDFTLVPWRSVLALGDLVAFDRLAARAHPPLYSLDHVLTTAALVGVPLGARRRPGLLALVERLAAYRQAFPRSLVLAAIQLDDEALWEALFIAGLTLDNTI